MRVQKVCGVITAAAAAARPKRRGGARKEAAAAAASCRESSSPRSSVQTEDRDFIRPAARGPGDSRPFQGGGEQKAADWNDGRRTDRCSIRAGCSSVERASTHPMCIDAAWQCNCGLQCLQIRYYTDNSVEIPEEESIFSWCFLHSGVWSSAPRREQQ
ncbi:hypothetical protein EYF80_048357 [Liparis tanakae]|uniref:Uncharacterized protein n=1 Tax=Liparis tanakae TaxID=230148 RepID=A0A4Z2FL41_9TELE|nr:hypothetical protein EYF80_048357 [Liparis tanakae]